MCVKLFFGVGIEVGVEGHTTALCFERLSSNYIKDGKFYKLDFKTFGCFLKLCF